MATHVGMVSGDHFMQTDRAVPYTLANLDPITNSA